MTHLNDVLTSALEDAIKIGEVKKGKGIFPYSLQYVNKKWRKIRSKAELDTFRVMT